MTTKPMAIHKRIVIQVLSKHPDELTQMFGDHFKTADEAISFLRGCDEEWLCGGELLTEAEYQAKWGNLAGSQK